jgi:superoxide dismutase, Cu-Zn family
MGFRISTCIFTLIAGALLMHGAAAGVGDRATAKLQTRTGESAGTVEFEQTAHGTLVHARLKNLPQGPRAFHVHQTGKCEPPFESAGGHFSPGGSKHGFESAKGPHPGDFPNIHIPAGGELEIEYLNTLLTLDDTLFDADGASVVIHEKPDDYRTDPAGAAGPRIACGVIERQP